MGQRHQIMSILVNVTIHKPLNFDANIIHKSLADKECSHCFVGSGFVGSGFVGSDFVGSGFVKSSFVRSSFVPLVFFPSEWYY